MLLGTWGGADGLVGSRNNISSASNHQVPQSPGSTQETLKDQLGLVGWVPHWGTEELTKESQNKDRVVSRGKGGSQVHGR